MEELLESENTNILSDDELKECLTKMEMGENSARDKIILHNLKLVLYRVQHKYISFCEFYEFEELVSIGIIGLIKAVDTYKPEKNIKLSSYAIKCIDNEINMFFRKSNKYMANFSLDKPLGDSSYDNETTYIDLLTFEDEGIAKIIEDDYLEKYKEVINKYIASLPKRDQIIIYKRFGFNGYRVHTLEEIGDSLGVSRSYIGQKVSLLLGRLSRTLKEIKKEDEEKEKILLKRK